MRIGSAATPDLTLVDARFYVPVRGGHRGQRERASEISERTTARGFGHHATITLRREQAPLSSLLQLPERLGSVLYCVDRRCDGEDAHLSAARTKPCVLRRVDGWSARTARAFALDCAERALPILEWHDPGDDRPARLLARARAALSADGDRADGNGEHRDDGWRERAWQDACAYEADILEHSCHPAIMPAARACVATVQRCAWGAVRSAVTNAREAEASRAAWDASWTAARDAAWFACTATETDAASAAAWNRTWTRVTGDVRVRQAGMLARRLGLTGAPEPDPNHPESWNTPE